MSRKKTVVLDVREDIRGGREPFGRIMQTAYDLRPNEDLLLIAPFEPAPLYHFLAAQGFEHTSKETESGDWEVRFTRGGPGAPGAPARPSDKAQQSACKGPDYVEVNARDLEPPGPLVKILEALSALPSGKGLRALTDRRPVHLYAELESRGFAAETQEQPDGSFVTHIRPA
jgi:uncharacterized protein (DUF2249 family)